MALTRIVISTVNVPSDKIARTLYDSTECMRNERYSIQDETECDVYSVAHFFSLNDHLIERSLRFTKDWFRKRLRRVS